MYLCFYASCILMLLNATSAVLSMWKHSPNSLLAIALVREDSEVNMRQIERMEEKVESCK